MLPKGRPEHPGAGSIGVPLQSLGQGLGDVPKETRAPGEGHTARPPGGPWPWNALPKSWPGAGVGIEGSDNLKVRFSGSQVFFHWTPPPRIQRFWACTTSM